jgi:copper transport protein
MTWDGSTVLYAAARWLGYLAAFVVVGGVVFRGAVLPRAAPGDPDAREAMGRRALGLAFGGALLLAAAHALRLWCQARSLLDVEEPVTAEFVGAILGTAWGHGWIAQAAAALVAALGAGLGRRRAAGVRLLLLGALGIVLAAPLTGHAVALPQAGQIGYALDLFHFGLGAAWLGTLAAMLHAGLSGPLAGTIPPKRLVAAFSPVALASGLGTIVIGGVIAWRYVGALEPFATSTYGRTVVLKVIALGGVAALGAYNWRVVQPRLHRDQPAPVHRSSGFEVLIGVILVALTAVLVSLPLPGEE